MPKKHPVAVDGGLQCKKCGSMMQRVMHPPGWAPKPDQPYYFAFWDKCECGMIQHYEDAKRIFDGPAVEVPVPSIWDELQELDI